MNAPSRALTDSATMFRRQLRHLLRYPSMTLILAGMPVVFLLLFVYVFGGVLGNGLAGGGRDAYLAYVTPGIIVLALAAAAQGTAISVAMDMTEGIIARFRTMPVARSSVLTGHVLGSLVQCVICVAVALGVAVAVGLRPAAGLLDWLAVAGVVVLTGFALTWLCVALGLVSKTVESASNLPMFLPLLPFLGSGFVPTGSMPTVLRWFAEYQPFTPITETLRALLDGTPVGNHAIVAVAWCAGITVLAFLWSRRLFARRTTQ
jgi:ABC-2 type transport system permease protein